MESLCLYPLYSDGVSPRYRCTYLLKYAGEEKLNMSEMSVKLRFRLRNCLDMSRIVNRLIHQLAEFPVIVFEISERYFGAMQSSEA